MTDRITTMRQEELKQAGLVLTIDVGTSSIRANLFTREARRLAQFETQLSYSAASGPPGSAEIDPFELLDVVCAAIDATLSRAGEHRSEIIAVGMCSLVSNVMGIDEASSPTTPIYTWADRRDSPQATSLKATLDQRAVLDRTGCPIHASYLPARLLWLKETEPESYTRTLCWISLGEWLQLNLLGRMAQSVSVAAWGGLLDRRTVRWDTEWLSFLQLDKGALPPLAGASEPLTGLEDRFARRWPMLRSVSWLPCIADGVTSNLGSGCFTPEKVAIQVGTSSAMRAFIPDTAREIPFGLWCYRVDRETSLLGGALSEGGNVFAWLKSLFGLQDFGALEVEAAQLAPDSHGMTMLPLLAGERSPGWHGAAQGAILGLTLDTRPAAVLRAAQEAIAYRFRLVYNLLLPYLPSQHDIVASGGALLNTPGWVQILADVLGHPITLCAEEEASSRGTALTVLRGLGLIPDLARIAPPLSRTVRPAKSRHAIYQRALQRQRALEAGLHAAGFPEPG